MSISSAVTGSVIAIMGIGALVLTPKVWGGWYSRRETRYRGQLRSHGELTFIWWPFGNATRRGLTRGFVPVTFAWWGFVVAYWIAMASGPAADRQSHAVRVAVLVGIVWFVAGMMLLLTVMFFNRPKFVVPPGHRGEPGAVAEWRASRARKRRRR